jgi:hypothetical protein
MKESYSEGSRLLAGVIPIQVSSLSSTTPWRHYLLLLFLLSLSTQRKAYRISGTAERCLRSNGFVFNQYKSNVNARSRPCMAGILNRYKSNVNARSVLKCGSVELCAI